MHRSAPSASAGATPLARAVIDLHCHILSGVDDGALDLADSVALGRQADRDGVAIVCATPPTSATTTMSASPSSPIAWPSSTRRSRTRARARDAGMRSDRGAQRDGPCLRGGLGSGGHG
jgi:hypothetical protein